MFWQLFLALLATVSLACGEDFLVPKPLADPPMGDYVQGWPEGIPPSVTRKLPLEFQAWDKPFGDAAGQRWSKQINQWFAERTAAGLTQDTFRSFDNDHSGVAKLFPQMRFAPATGSYFPPVPAVFAERVTFGVQSLGFHESPFGEPLAICEYFHRVAILHQLDPRRLEAVTKLTKPEVTQEAYRLLYENNLLLVTPAVWNYLAVPAGDQDSFSFLSPFYLHSVGKSGSDAHLLKPILYAAAALPPAIKTRALRSGTYAPLLLGLFKQHVGQGPRHESSHRAAFALPEDAKTSAAFLANFITAAHDLGHLPPVAKITVTEKQKSPVGYFGAFGSLIAVALRQGEVFEATIDLEASWFDTDKKLLRGDATVLREPLAQGTLEEQLRGLLARYTEQHPEVVQARARLKAAQRGVTRLEKTNATGTRWKVRMPWQEATGTRRSDIVFLVNDGTYDSAPAYLSVRHLQATDAWAGP